MPDNVSYRALEDNDGYIWFGTNKGLIRLNPENRDIRVSQNKMVYPIISFHINRQLKVMTELFGLGL